MKCHWAFSFLLWFIPRQSCVKMALTGCCVKSQTNTNVFIPVQSLPFQIAGWVNQENFIIYYVIKYKSKSAIGFFELLQCSQNFEEC